MNKFSYKDGSIEKSKYRNYNKILHNENGPAVEYFDGSKYWYIDNQFHRLNGPAIKLVNGDKEYWIYDNYLGINLTEEEFEKLKNKVLKEMIFG